MRRVLLGVTACALTLGLTFGLSSSAQAQGNHGHGNGGHGYGGHGNGGHGYGGHGYGGHGYGGHGSYYHGGGYDHGFAHSRWGGSRWDPVRRCNVFFDPNLNVWFYYDASCGRYLPCG